MDWLVFGDDWAKHPTTTQHLIRNLPASDRVIWINSIGMRSPGFELTDMRRLLSKGSKLLGGGGSKREKSPENSLPFPMCIIHPRIAPWHLRDPVVAVNRAFLGHQVRSAMRSMGMVSPVVLCSNPVAINYLDFGHRAIAYLRLDEYSKLPGVDPELVHQTEPTLIAHADAVFATARRLLPAGERLQHRCHYLPQGVEVDHFAEVPLRVPDTKTLGFFGLLAEWIDYQLVEQVAKLCPDWTLEFLGPVRYVPDKLNNISNIRFLDPVPYDKLPKAIHHWSAGWIPFEVSELTASVNPIKLREYLAAGLPTISTPMPEALTLGSLVKIVKDASDMTALLASIQKTDSIALRTQRRKEMGSHSWQSRSAQLRAVFC